MLLTRDQILGAQDLKRETVDVPEWGGAVIVRELTAVERMAFEQEVLAAGGVGQLPPDVVGRVAAWCIIDEKGQRVFSDEDGAALGAKSTDAILRVFRATMRLSAFAPEDEAALRKNSASSPGGGSSSG